MGIRRSEGGVNELNMEEGTERYYEERFDFFLIFFFGTGENINQSVELPLDKVGFEVWEVTKRWSLEEGGRQRSLRRYVEVNEWWENWRAQEDGPDNMPQAGPT